VLLLRNMSFMLPALLYSAVVFPRWHHAPYRLEAWSVKVIAGWAHFFAYWDAIRGKPLGWKPTGSDRRKQDGRRRFWVCFLIWTLGSALLWSGLALWRMMTMDPENFAVLFALGVFEVMIAVRVLIKPAISRC
jgi:cellulose synthase (UDP-forming)